MPNTCIVTTLPFAAPAGWTGPTYQTPAEQIVARSSLTFWGDGSTATVSGGTVTTLASRKAGGVTYAQGTTARQPTYTANGNAAVIGGQAFLTFDGTNEGTATNRDFMAPSGLANLNPASPYTVIDVLRPDNLPAQTENVWGSHLDTDNSLGVYIGTTGVAYTHGNSTGRLLQAITAGTWIACAAGWNGTRHTLVCNGVRQTGTPTSTPANAISLRMGARADDVGRYTGGLAMRMIFQGEDVTADAAFWAVIRDYIRGYFNFASDPLAA